MDSYSLPGCNHLTNPDFFVKSSEPVNPYSAQNYCYSCDLAFCRIEKYVAKQEDILLSEVVFPGADIRLFV